ncbi:putative anti-sigma factor [Nocardia nova SH22a]|uniref:Putative anti-sigma factor n=1 Tax=Nocardia nova SH22a TaxID=1415166 RepID=W5TC88_9NOCA|nr:anti-sigma factor [Nocardia nova]AHH16804.1 putative anti-sigma factor [Nocardia nova SH22a]
MAEKVSPEAGTTAIGFRVPAVADQLIMTRALTETVALVADFGIDEATDIRLAVDEVVSALIVDAVAGSEIDCTFTAGESTMDVRVAAVTTGADCPDTGGFGWHIVSTLTQWVHTSNSGYDESAGGWPTVVEFRWARGGTDVA